MIPSFSHITIRVTYRPAEVGNFAYIVRIENVKDPNSVHFINIQSSVVSELRPVRPTPPVASSHISIGTQRVIADRLLPHLLVSFQKSVLLSVVKLDFGDCYTSVPVYQVLTVKNVTEDTMDVFFDSDSSHEVSFDLITENDQQESARQRAAADETYDSDSDSSSDSGSDTSAIPGIRGLFLRRLSFSFPASLPLPRHCSLNFYNSTQQASRTWKTTTSFPSLPRRRQRGATKRRRR